jgi:hypothetical protein
MSQKTNLILTKLRRFHEREFGLSDSDIIGKQELTPDLDILTSPFRNRYLVIRP